MEATPPRSYPAYPVATDPVQSPLKVAWLFALIIAAAILAHFYYFFHERGGMLEAVIAEGALPPGLRGRFYVQCAGVISGAIVYTLFFAWLAMRRGMDFGQALRALTPGFAGCLLYVMFLFVGNPEYSTSAEAYVVRRLPLVMLAFWPFWRLKLLRGWAPTEWGSAARVAGKLLLGGVGALLVFNAMGHAFAKWWGWSHNLPDMGLYVQMIWGFANGKPLHNTPYALPGDLFLNGEHALFSVAILTPLAWLGDIPLALVVVHSIIFLVSALLVARLARHYTAMPWVPALLAVMFLANPFVDRGWVDDFHIDALEIPLFLGMWLVAIGWRGWARWAAFLALMLVLLGCKEDAGLTVGAMGLVLLFRAETRWLGLVALLVGPACTFAELKWVLTQTRGSAHLGNYAALGETPGEIVKTVFTRPDIVLGELLQHERRASIARLLVAGGLLALFAPEALLLAGGAVLTTLLSTWDKQYKLESHYGLDFVGPMTVAMVWGWGRLESLTAFIAGTPHEETLAARARRHADEGWAAHRPREPWNQHESELEWRMMLFGAIALGLAVSAHHEYAKFSALKPMRWLAGNQRTERMNGFHEHIGRRVSADDGVATQNHLGSLFAAREYVMDFPPPLAFRTRTGDFDYGDRLDVIILDALGEMADPRDVVAWLRRAVDTEGFQPEAYWEGYLILRRRGEEPAPPDAAEWVEDFIGRVRAR